MRSKILTAGMALSLLAGCKPKTESGTTRKAVAGPAVLRDVARLTGTVAPSDTIQIKSQVTQQITRILAKEGDFVKKGQLLFDLDREQLQLKHEQLSIAVASARLGVQAAERDLDRAQTQLRNGSVSADHVQDLQFARDRARLALRNSELDLKSNERDLYYTRITAPRDGQLIRLNASEGEMAVSANSVSGGVLGVIADPSRLKVVVEVSELDYPRLKLGQDVEISTESQSDKLLQGSVSYIPPSAQASSSNSSVMVFKVEVSLDPAAKPKSLSEVAGGIKRRREGAGLDSSRSRHAGVDSIRPAPGKNPSGKRNSPEEKSKAVIVPGMTVNVDFVFVEKKIDVGVPFDMVSTTPDGSAKLVWVHGKADEGPAKERKVGVAPMSDVHPKRIQVGATDFKIYEVLSGLSAGDTIFAAPDSTGKSSRKKGPGGPP